MKRWMSGGVVLRGGVSWRAPGLAQTRAKAENVPEIPIESVPNFLKMPENVYLGESMGVATNSKGHIFVYHRRDDTRLFEFDENGTFVKEWGEGIYGFEFAHKVRVDKDDNVWVVDEGTNMVIKFNPEGRVVMVLGRRPGGGRRRGGNAAGRSAAGRAVSLRAARPTSAWDAQGNIFVSDGYINHRVVKYDKNGRFIRQVGQPPARAPSRTSSTRRIRLPPTRRATSTSPTAATRASRCSTTTWCSAPSTTTSAIRGKSASRPGRTSTCSRRTRIPTRTPRRRGRPAARSTRWSSTGRSSASSARRARRSASSRPCTASTAAIPTS